MFVQVKCLHVVKCLLVQFISKRRQEIPSNQGKVRKTKSFPWMHQPSCIVLRWWQLSPGSKRTAWIAGPSKVPHTVFQRPLTGIGKVFRWIKKQWEFEQECGPQQWTISWMSNVRTQLQLFQIWHIKTGVVSFSEASFLFRWWHLTKWNYATHAPNKC